MRLIWSKASLRDLEEIAVHIEQDSPRVAELVEERIHQNALLLARFPKSGRLGRVSGTRERVVSRTPFILAYRANTRVVRILRIYRGARRWPNQF